MTDMIRGGLVRSLLILIAAGALSAGLAAQDEEYVPDPTKKITVDFVQKDLHTVIHYIALRSGLNVIVQGDVSVKLTVMFRDVDPREAMRTICKANKLDFVEDGSEIIIKTRPQDTALANVVAGVGGLESGRFNARFESQELVAAIMEVAAVTGAQVLIPSVPQVQQDREEEERAGEERVRSIQERRISMHMREATPEQILKRLAELGDLIFSIIPPAGNSAPGDDMVEGEAPAYKFTYRIVRPGGGASQIIDADVKFDSRAYFIPGGSMTTLKSEVQSLLSTAGKVVIDERTNYLVVWEREDAKVDGKFNFEGYMDTVVERSEALAVKAEADAEGDKMAVREYRLIRNTTDPAVAAAVTGILSDEGRILLNPDRNSIVVYERESRLKDLDQLMASMDMAPEQVLITAKLVEVTLDEYMGYGLELFTNQSASSLNDGRFTASSQDGAGRAGGLFGQPTGFDPFFATFSNPRLDVRLELLANEGRVETLSQPTQMVSNRQQARIEVGQEIPYLESSGASGGSTTASVSFKEVSIVMEVTPTVLENGLIRLEVTVTVREVIGNIAIEGNNTPVLSLRESRTDVFIRDGETLVMGGLIRERERMEENGLPFLKDIPFLGYLFKSANKTTSKTDLLFFLRPQIVNAAVGPSNSESGAAVERDRRPVIYQDGDDRKADIRPGRFRKLSTATKPAWYNEQTRPKTAAEVKPGA